MFPRSVNYDQWMFGNCLDLWHIRLGTISSPNSLRRLTATEPMLSPLGSSPRFVVSARITSPIVLQDAHYFGYFERRSSQTGVCIDA